MDLLNQTSTSDLTSLNSLQMQVLVLAFQFQTHPREAQRGDPRLCERFGLQVGASPGGEHGPEALGPPGLCAAPEPGGRAESRDGARRAHRAGGVAPAPLSSVWSLPPLAGYSTGQASPYQPCQQ